MNRALMCALLLVVAAPACTDSTGLDCPVDTLDCNQPGLRVHVLTVRVTSETGVPVAGATVRVERTSLTGMSFALVDSTTAQGALVVDFSYQGDAIRPPEPIRIRVTPSSGSDLGPAIVADTVVYARREIFRERVIILPLLPNTRAP